MRVFLLVVFVVAASAASERVVLRQINTNNDVRSLSSPRLEFELRRSTGITTLKLEENRRVNSHAPVYEVERTGVGKQRLVRKTGTPELTTRFFHDKTNQGAFKMTYDKERRSMLSGSFRSGNKFYRLSAVPAKRTLGAQDLNVHTRSMPYTLEEETMNDARGTHSVARAEEDYVEVPGSKRELSDMLDELQSILDETQLNKLKKKLLRKKRASPLYALELVVAADPTVWKKFYARTVADNVGLSEEEAKNMTELNLREHFVHIVSGMSLRYESINDPDMNIYLTITGFIFYQTRNDTNPLPLSEEILSVDGKEVVNGSSYLYALVPWAAGLGELPHNDHILVFTDYDIYGYFKDDTSTAGIAFVEAICSTHRVSINEDNDYFTTVSVASHELGHNLGALHDGNDTTISCPEADKFIMAPKVSRLGRSDAYTPNPWTFSSCSILAFKTTVDRLGSNHCLTDPGDYYNDAEYNAHKALLPGQLRSVEEQCVLERGKGSFLCTGLTSPEGATFCQSMSCFNPPDDLCYFYTPARGTDCGTEGANTYCIDGQCVAKPAATTTIPATTTIRPVTTTSTTNSPSTTATTTIRPVTTTTTTTRPKTTTTTRPQTTTTTTTRPKTTTNTTTRPKTTTTTTKRPPVCRNTLYQEYGVGCYKLAKYFWKDLRARPDEWCLIPEWKFYCCRFCKGNGVF